MIKKFLTMLLVAIMLVATTACGGDKDPNKRSDPSNNSETNAIVGIYYGGYGTEAIQKVADAFNAKQENKDRNYTVSISDQGGGFIASNVTSKLQGAQGDFDLMLTATVSVYNIIDRGNKYLAGYDYALEDISDVYNSKVPGEDVLYKDKMIKQFYEYNTFNNSQYSINWATGPSGIAYRADFFEDNGWETPVTTEELRELATKIKNAGYTPYIWSSSGSYWYYSVLAWWRQLINEEEFNAFLNVEDQNGETSLECFKSQSRLMAFEELESILGNHYYTNEKGKLMSDGYLFDEGTQSNIEAQISLYTTKNKICMMANSDWLENEMKQADFAPGDRNIGLFKTPVTSKILKKYDAAHPNGVDRFETVKTEEKLREVIHAIDDGKTGVEGVSSEDFDSLKVIRSYTGTEGQNHIAFIPSYANAKPVAKEFLRYLATDEALQIYYNETGTFLPFNNSGVTPDNSTTFRKNVYKLAAGSHYISTFDSKNPLFYKTDLNYFMSTKPEQKIATSSRTDVMTAQQLWTYIYDEAVKIWDNVQAQAKA